MRPVSLSGVVLFALLLALPVRPALAQGCDESRVRVLLVDLAAGSPVAVLRSQTGDPNAAEAVARWDAAVRPRSPERFARKLQYGKGWTVVLAGSRIEIDGSEVRLNTDGRPMSPREADIRLRMLDLALGAPAPEAPPPDSDDGIALRRRGAGVTVTNGALFERREGPGGKGKLVRAGTDRLVAGWEVRLSSDPGATCYTEAQVRRILADIALDGPLDYYETHRDEPGVAEALRRREAGVRVMNLDRFERNIVKGKGWQVVHKRSHVPIEGTEVELSSF